MKSNKPICYPYFFLLVVYLFSLVTNLPISASYGGNETDHTALLSFKSMITHDPYGALTSWNTSSHFCDWNGVVCGKKHKRVRLLTFNSLGLEGYLSPQVGNLSFLRSLSLRNNSFLGTIPPELGRLSRLRLLHFGSNNFEGTIPTNLSGCSNLEKLVLATNKLVGRLPKETGFLSKLSLIVIHENNFIGGIPPFLGNLTLMETFSATTNSFGGNIPDTLRHWKSLKVFYSGSCHLQGTIPDFFYNFSLLTDLSLADNHFTGNLPSTIGATLPQLVRLQLPNNQLTGVLPPSIANCSNLEVIEVSDCKFSGKVIVDFAKLVHIYKIALIGNLFGSGDVDEIKFIDSLKNCTGLDILDIAYCKFQGVLPMSIGNLSTQLSYLSLGENQLYGTLPSSIGNLVGLTNLYLGGNKFIGKIPSTIGALQNAGVISMSHNQLEGLIPDSIGNLSSLIMLVLNANRLEGRIPSSIGNCHNLSQLYLAANNLNGEIPKHVLQLPSLSIVLNLSHNNLSGSLPPEVGDLKMLTYLDLSSNQLSGIIPNSIGGCTSLLFLSLKGNLFQGTIPSSLSSMRGVAELYLSYNNLSGLIPQFLEHLSLQILDLSFNDFEGEVPIAGAFSNASAILISGNPRLCGGLVELGLMECKDIKKRKIRFPLFVIAILIVVTVFPTLWFMCVWFKKKNKIQESQSLIKEPFSKVSYGQLLKATNGFSEDNLIGTGHFSSVYKGIVENDDKFVAIKVLHLQIKGAHKSFMAECEVLRSIRHRNLLKIITSCASVDFQGNDFEALVYEFMPNGNLDDWLHSSERRPRLELLQRIRILIDVAFALDYLHNHCVPTIVHGDLKPSNILLDDDMVAHVGDFGLARFLGTFPNRNSSLDIRGTTGYAAPEYGLGSAMTSSGDVYSFGILLLEMMTSKRPTDDIFRDGVTLHKFSHMALPDHIVDVIDSNLLNVRQDDVIASILKIGISCSMESPSQRMNIENVVHELQHTMATLQNV